MCRFRNDLKAAGLGEALFAEVGRQLDAAGFLVKSGTLIDADKAYDKKARRLLLKAQGIKDRIQHRRNKHQKALPVWQKVRHVLIGRIRGAVERTFSVLKGHYGLRRLRYFGLAAGALQLDLMVIAFNLRPAAALRP